MDAKNLMLLGFVNKAVDYLNKNMDNADDENARVLSKMNIDAIRQGLSDEFSASFGGNEEAVSSLLNAGSNAFDDFISVQKDKSLADEFSDMLDVDLDEDSHTEFNELLDFYNLSKELFLSDDKVEETIANVRKNNAPAKEEKPAEKVKEEIPEEKAEARPSLKPKLEKEEEEDELPFHLSEEDSQLLKMISNNVSINANRAYDADSSKAMEARKLDSIFREVNNPHRDEEEKPNNGLDVMGKKDDDVFDYALDKAFKSAETTPVRNTSDVDSFIFNPTSSYLQPPGEEEIRIGQIDEHKVGRDDIVDLVKNIQADTDFYYGSNAVAGIAKEEPEPDSKGIRDANYISTLIDELKNQFLEEENRKRLEKERNKEIFDRIHRTYPYLSNTFIETVYSMKDSLRKDYPLDVSIIILHRSYFADVESLRQFVEIALSHDYAINADEDKMIVDVFKEYTNSDGKILTSIFEVANQAALLNGEYDGFRVMLSNDMEM